jgi:predicted GNAT family acetyltransferase
MPDVEVRDNPAANRYEAWVDEELAGFAEYQPAGGRLVFVHTEVLPAFAGRGIGSRLAAGALNATRARGLKMTPRCPFIAAYIRSHPEYRDMVVGARGSSAAHGPGDRPPDGGGPEAGGSGAGGPDGGAPAG